MYGVIFAEHVTGLVNDVSLPSYSDARRSFREADSLRAALEGMNGFDTLEEAAQTEARAVLDALPRAVDKAIVAAAESALENGIPIVAEWHAGPTIEVRVSEVGNALHVDFISPEG